MTGYMTVFESTRELVKRWELDEADKLRKTTAAQMTKGTYRVESLRDVHELKALAESVSIKQALCCSLPRNGEEAGRVVTRAALADHPGAVARTKESFGLAAGPGVLFLDCDQAGISRDALWQMLTAAVPALSSAGVLWRPSGSSHVFKGDDDLTGLRGQHLYVLIADASDGPRVVKVLADRLWLAGLGSVLVSASGSLLIRSPIDTAPADAARLIFAGGAHCVPPLEQRRGPAVVISDGGFLDSVRVVPDLTAEERGRVEALVEQAKAARTTEAMQRRAEHRAERMGDLVPRLMQAGVSAIDAEQRIGAAIDAAYGGVLLGDFELTVVHDDGRHEGVTVAQVLADRDHFHEVDILDPLNPEHRGGSPDARLYLHGTSPIAYSLDDGGLVYRLRTQQVRISAARGSRAELVRQLADLVAGLDCVFMSDVGPVLIDGGQRWPLTVEKLMNLIGREVVLTVKNRTGEGPMDLQREVASLVLAELPHTSGNWRIAK